jgi:hypothetical protein
MKLDNAYRLQSAQNDISKGSEAYFGLRMSMELRMEAYQK